MATFRITAVTNRLIGETNRLGMVAAMSGYYMTREEAEAVAATFSRKAGVDVTPVSTADGERFAARLHNTYLLSQKNNERNETGIARVKRFVTEASTAGHTFEYAEFGNQVAHNDSELESVIAAY